MTASGSLFLRKSRVGQSGTGRQIQAPVSCCSVVLCTGFLTACSPQLLDLSHNFYIAASVKLEGEEGMEGPWQPSASIPLARTWSCNPTELQGKLGNVVHLGQPCAQPKVEVPSLDRRMGVISLIITVTVPVALTVCGIQLHNHTVKSVWLCSSYR